MVMVATAIYTVTMVLWKETAFPLCRAMEMRWKTNVVRHYYYYYHHHHYLDHWQIINSNYHSSKELFCATNARPLETNQVRR